MSVVLAETHAKLMTAVFVDYECWYWGLHNQGSGAPNLKEFVDSIKTKGILQQITFFGDFSKELAQEKNKIRTITTDIIDSATNNGIEKSYTDFMMLHHIYRTCLSDDKTEQYVLVTGDGHFSDVVAFLRTFRNKSVGVYAVEGTLSRQLKEAASWCQEIKRQDRDRDCEEAVLRFVKQKVEIDPDFVSSATFIANSLENQYDEYTVRQTFRSLYTHGYATKEIRNLPSGKEITAVVFDWERINQVYQL
jgi:uncharacterized LabA/DUF88 family protein